MWHRTQRWYPWVVMLVIALVWQGMHRPRAQTYYPESLERMLPDASRTAESCRFSSAGSVFFLGGLLAWQLQVGTIVFV
jgi:hypothetical protein